MGIGNVISWLAIFIIGSLIVSAIINPQVYDTLESKYNKIIDSIGFHRTKIIASNNNDEPYKCSEIELGAAFFRVSDIKESGCRQLCGKKNMTFTSFNCDKDILTCYCK